MSDRPSESVRPFSPVHDDYVAPGQPSAWSGWVDFAALMMVLIGTLHVIQGMVALFNDEYYLVTQGGLVVTADFTAWGWVHVLWGALLIAAAFALYAGKTWGAVVAVVLAMFSVIINIGFLAAYPIWSVIMITIDILVIWALTVHGPRPRR
ncbi:DUF7144 family membrane protein [Nocardioides sp.]|uniref:DUF7144 family membrane protein n=1 Tax=Nocardioides sp. TaxID=35761 RepID=UPI003D1436EA